VDTSSTNTIGKYQIIREIARSNDVVYEAIDPSINRRIALKELSIPTNVDGAQRRERIERFWREGKAAGRLSHPNIVTIFEVGKDGDRHFIAMEFLEGQTLRDALQAGGPMPIPTVKSYALQLCDALSYAHRNGVVHRDIKPDNVQILPGGHIKLTDFGIARLMGEPTITQNGQVFGTPSYMSPEQVKGGEIDARSDIFSLGVLLYEMVTGKKPFTGDTVVTITYNITSVDPPPPQGAPPWLSGIILKAMAKDPEMRYQSVDELAEDLREERSSRPSWDAPNGVAGYPSPFGGASQSPSQQPSVPITPYGTPVPTTGAGAPPCSVSDPFASGVPSPPPDYQPPTSYAPPKPAMSPETRTFLGVFLLVIGLAGMIGFAIWAVSLAYSSYSTLQTSASAARYYEQGRKLHSANQLDAAEQQYRNAIRVSPKSDSAENAREGIYQIWAARAYSYVSSNNRDALADIAKRMVESRPNAPEGHYYLGLTYELAGETAKAIEEYETASTLAGNDKQGYGKAARERRDRLQAARQAEPSRSSQPAPSSPRSPQGGDGIEYEPGTQGGQ